MNRPLLSHYDAIYLSPHLDDVALSCGGQIAQRTTSGQSVLILTVMAGDPVVDTISDYAKSLHERWEFSAAAAAGRRAEDIAACVILNADALHWEVPDCIYRHDPDGTHYYVSDDDIFGEIAPAELALVDDLAARLTTLPRHDRLFVPLTVGHHVDHLLTRAAAERAVNPGQIVYYADYPYAADAAALEQAASTLDRRWMVEVSAINPAALKTKIDAISAHASQLSTFWRDQQELVAEVTAYVNHFDGEPLWRQSR